MLDMHWHGSYANIDAEEPRVPNPRLCMHLIEPVSIDAHMRVSDGANATNLPVNKYLSIRFGQINITAKVSRAKTAQRFSRRLERLVGRKLQPSASHSAGTTPRERKLFLAL